MLIYGKAYLIAQQYEAIIARFFNFFLIFFNFFLSSRYGAMIQFFYEKGTFNYRTQNDNITHRTKEMTKLRLLLLSLKKSWVDKNAA